MNQTRWERLSGIYHAAREQPDEKRRAFLDDACSGDPEMRAEIESLLRHELPSLPAFSAIAAHADTVSEQPVAPGTQIGIYRIERALGAGGMGEVHLATDTRLNRPVALKFVSAAANQDARRRFQQETRAVSSLNHPHILTVHDSGQFAGREYLVTEFVDGGTLKTWLDAAPRTWRQKIELLIGVADALATAHDAGILHRDVKPANILVAQHGYAKLADFGLAKLGGTPDLETQSEPRTGPGAVVGTIDYMSPEQLSGVAIDRRSDVFSFGIVLYETLAGQRPFVGETTLHVVEGILRQAPPPLAGDIPARLREVVGKALEKEPADRYQSVRDLVVDLRRLVRQTTEVPAAAAAPNRRRWWPPAAALAAALLVVGIAAAAWWRSAPAPIQSIAVLPFRNLCGNDLEYVADGLTEDLITALIDSGLYAHSPRTMFQFKNRAGDVRDLGRRLSVDAVMDGSVRCQDDRMRVSVQLSRVADGYGYWSRKWDVQGNGILETQQRIADQVARSLRPSGAGIEIVGRSPTTDKDAYEHYSQGQFHRRRGDGLRSAEQAYLRAIALDEQFAEAYAGLAILLNEAASDGRLKPSDAFPKAKEAVAKALKINPHLATAISARGWIAMHFEWNWNAAEQDLLEAIKLNPRDPETHHSYSHYLLATGRFDESLARSNEAIRHDKANAAMLGHLVLHFGLAREYTRAVDAMKAALAFDSDSRDVWTFGARAYEYSGQLADAIEARKYLGRPRELIERLQTGLAEAGAEGYWRALRDYEIDQSRKGSANARSLATAYAYLGKHGEAIQVIRRAADDREGWIPYLNVNPAFDGLREDADFKALLKHIFAVR